MASSCCSYTIIQTRNIPFLTQAVDAVIAFCLCQVRLYSASLQLSPVFDWLHMDWIRGLNVLIVLSNFLTIKKTGKTFGSIFFYIFIFKIFFSNLNIVFARTTHGDEAC